LAQEIGTVLPEKWNPKLQKALPETIQESTFTPDNLKFTLSRLLPIMEPLSTYYAEWNIAVLDFFAGTSLVSAKPRICWLVHTISACIEARTSHPDSGCGSICSASLVFHRCMSLSRLHFDGVRPMVLLSYETPTNYSLPLISALKIFSDRNWALCARLRDRKGAVRIMRGLNEGRKAFLQAITAF
jgi:hypothetical protein